MATRSTTGCFHAGHAGALSLLLALAFVSVHASDMPLAVRGMPPDRTIVIPASASPSQRYAAEELRDFTEKTTGVRLPIATDAEPLPAKAILLGETKWTAELAGRVALNAPGGGLGADVKNLGTDGFRLVARPPHLLVVGSPERGTLYGVYELLERFAGCRWYASWHSVIPAAGSGFCDAYSLLVRRCQGWRVCGTVARVPVKD